MSDRNMDRLEPRRLFADTLSAAIDGAKTYQTIDGIGAAITNYQQSDYRSAAYLNKITGDLGITAVRAAIDPGWELQNDSADPNTFDWTKFDDAAIAPVMEFFAQAKARGVKTFLLTVWTPSSWLKTNKAAAQGGQLRPELRDEYAEYITAAVIRAKTRWGVDINHVSIMNEPWFTEPYVSNVFTPVQWRETLKVVAARFKKEGLATQIVGPEDVSSLYRTTKYVQTVAADPVANAAMPIIGTHYLNDQDGQTLAQTAATLKKKIWFTEIGNGNPDFAGALGLARGIDSAFTRVGASAWINWQLTNSKPFESILSAGGVPNPKYYALKHFAHFIRPGAQRIDVKYSGDTVRVSAFRDPATGALTIELSNNRATPVDVNLSLAGLALPAKFQQWRTTATENCVRLADLVGGAKPQVTLPAGSIVTLYAGPDLATPQLTTASAFAAQHSWADAWNTDPLRSAAIRGDLAAVQTLIAGGANVNAAFGNGWTPLFCAAASPYNKSDQIITALLAAGADPQHRDVEGDTALHIAAMSSIGAYGTVDSIAANRIKLLLNAGIPANAKDNAGRTALMYAAELPKLGGDFITVDTSVIQMLLNNGADRTLKDNAGNIAADYAIRESADAATALLKIPTPPPPPPPGTASIKAYVINDVNKDGLWSTGEIGIAGRRVWLDMDNDGVLDAAEPNTLTGVNGVFSFTGLAAGTYAVRQVLPTGWKQTYPFANAALAITLATGQQKSGNSLGTALL